MTSEAFDAKYDSILRACRDAKEAAARKFSTVAMAASMVKAYATADATYEAAMDDLRRSV